jgi:hypothetical protein
MMSRAAQYRAAAGFLVARVAGLLLVTALRRPGPALTEPVVPPLVPAEPASRMAQPVTLVVGFDGSEPAGRPLVTRAGLEGPGPGPGLSTGATGRRRRRL